MIIFWSLRWPETKLKQSNSKLNNDGPWKKSGTALRLSACRKNHGFKKENGTYSQSLQSAKLSFRVSDKFILSIYLNLLSLLLQFPPGTSPQIYGAWMTVVSSPHGLWMLDFPLTRSQVSYTEVRFFPPCLMHIFLRCQLLQMASILIDTLKYTQNLNLSSYYNGASWVHGGEENLGETAFPLPPQATRAVTLIGGFC